MSTRERAIGGEGTLGAPVARRSRLPDRQALKVLLAGSGLLGRFTYLVATQVVTVVLGLAYWTTTARLVPSDQVGVAAAGMSAAIFLAMFGVLGVGTLMLVVLGSVEAEDERPVVSTGLLVACGAVGLLAAGAWGLSPFLGPSLRALGANPLDGALFVLGTMVYTAGVVLDSAAIGLRRGPAQLARNAVASVLKVALVLACVELHTRSTTGLLVAWVAALGVSLAVSPRLLHLRPSGGPVGLARRVALVRRYASLAIGHHLLNLAIGSVTYVLPVVAAMFVLPREMAYFSVAQLVSGSALLLPFLLATSLFVESTGDDEALRRNVRKTFPIGLACCAGVLGVLEPGGGTVLSVFGSQYALHGEAALRLLLLAGIPYVVKDHFMAIRRSQNRLGEAARVGMVSTSAEVLAAALGGWLGGLLGLCLGWVAATFVEGACFLPAVWRVLHAPAPRPPAGPGEASAAGPPAGYALP